MREETPSIDEVENEPVYCCACCAVIGNVDIENHKYVISYYTDEILCERCGEEIEAFHLSQAKEA